MDNTIYKRPDGSLVTFSYGAMYEAFTGKCLDYYGDSKRASSVKASPQDIKGFLKSRLATATIGTGGLGGSYTTGADPEIFVVDKDGKMIPAWKILPKGDTQVYPDGFALEIAAAAGSCFSYVCDSVQAGLRKCNEIAKEAGGKLSASDCLYVDMDILNNAPEEHVQLGCAPSYNAYGEVAAMPTGRQLPFRTTGSHFHYGSQTLSDMSLEDMTALVRMVEALRVPIFTAAFGHLENPLRRTLYGRIGEFRKPKWGLELRSTGAVVMRHPMLYHFVSTISRYCVDFVIKHGIGSVSLPLRTSVQSVGNNSDVTRARKILKDNPVYGCILRSTFHLIPDKDKFGKDMLNLLTSKEGLANVLDIADPSCVEKNWLLNSYWTAHSEGTNCNVSGWYKNFQNKKFMVAGA